LFFCFCCVAQRQLIKLAGAHLCKNWRALAPKARLKAPRGASQQLAFKGNVSPQVLLGAKTPGWKQQNPTSGNVSQQVLLRGKDHRVQTDARLAAIRDPTSGNDTEQVLLEISAKAAVPGWKQ
jgi:hypothetical protein